MRFLLVGNYGDHNLGDEALKDYFLKHFPDIEWSVVSADPNTGEYPRLPTGLRSLFAGSWIKTLGALKKSDGMVFGGGSLFTDIESLRACWLWWIHAAVGRFFGKPILLAFQGIGPFHTRVGEWFARSVVEHAHFVSVRDPESLLRLQSWRLRCVPVETFDPVLSLVQKGNHRGENSKTLAIIPRKNSGVRLLHRMQKRIENHGFESIKLISMQPGDATEESTIETLAQSINVPSTIIPVRTLQELEGAIQTCNCVLSERFHGGLIAWGLGIPVEIVTQAPGDKLSQLQGWVAQEGTDERFRALIRKGEDALRKVLKDVSGRSR